MRVGGLFSGIGGIELGLERAGMTIAWHCEQDPYCQQVLAKHWPGVPCYPDVTTLKGADVEPIDLLCGGFPCQDLSVAGKGAGITGSRSGLYAEVIRLVRELRPRYVLLENVAVLVARGLGTVVGDLASVGYDAEWDCVPASAVGAPHQRDRIWIVAYPEGSGLEGARVSGRSSERGPVGDAYGSPTHAHTETGSPWRSPSESGWWATEPDVGRVADGVPHAVDRLRGLGNAVVPQIPEIIGRRLMEREAVAA